MTGKKIGCVQHDCDDCMAFNKALADTIAEAEDQVQAELLSGNAALSGSDAAGGRSA